MSEPAPGLLATAARRVRRVARTAGLVVRFAGPHRKLLFAACGLSLLVGAADALVPLIGAPLVAVASGSGLRGPLEGLSNRLASVDREAALLYGLVGVAGAMICRGLLLATARSMSYHASARIVNHLRTELVGSLLGASFPFLDRMKGGVPRHVVMTEAGKVIAGSRALADLATGVISSTALVVLLWSVSPRLTLIVAAAVVAAFPLKLLQTRALRRAAERNLQATLRLNNRLNEILLGIRAIKLTNRSREWQSRVAADSAASEAAARSAAVLTLWEPVMVQSLALAMIVVVLLLGRVTDLAPLGEMVAYFFVLWRALPAVEALSTALNQLLAVGPALDAVAGWLPLPDADSERVRQPPLASPRVEELRFSGVRFGYAADRLVLDGVDVVARRGEMVAVVGPSGSGKTSLLHLALGMYEPWAGRVTLDGQAVSELSLSAVRDAVGIVSQDVHLFNATVRDLVAGGRDLPEADLEAAARDAEVTPFLATLPKGWSTKVGERGVRLSGGQRQRLLIAQTIARRPPVLLFDEATSALDPGTERRIFLHLEERRAEHVLLVVTHRVANLKGFDRIYVMEGGRVTQQGRFEELAAADGAFSQLLKKGRASLRQPEPDADPGDGV
ncbi:MAG: ABC transporter ATP-binding protein/permease [Vicinamibacteria bacterium]|nr:ABC transporter ATP-binding protein/permease [Vicinamibacteria bacterium]